MPPPATSTRPSCSRVAVDPYRASSIGAVGVQTERGVSKGVGVATAAGLDRNRQRRRRGRSRACCRDGAHGERRCGRRTRGDEHTQHDHRYQPRVPSGHPMASKTLRSWLDDRRGEARGAVKRDREDRRRGWSLDSGSMASAKTVPSDPTTTDQNSAPGRFNPTGQPPRPRPSRPTATRLPPTVSSRARRCMIQSAVGTGRWASDRRATELGRGSS